MESEIWKAVMDDRFAVKVERTGPYKGVLTIVDNHDEYKELHREEVGLMFGAIFGPDMDDVNAWEQTCLKVIDALDLPL